MGRHSVLHLDYGNQTVVSPPGSEGPPLQFTRSHTCNGLSACWKYRGQLTAAQGLSPAHSQFC